MDRRSFLGTSAKIGVAGMVAAPLLASCAKGNKVTPLRNPDEYYVPELLWLAKMYNNPNLATKMVKEYTG